MKTSMNLHEPSYHKAYILENCSLIYCTALVQLFQSTSVTAREKEKCEVEIQDGITVVVNIS